MSNVTIWWGRLQETAALVVDGLSTLWTLQQPLPILVESLAQSMTSRRIQYIYYQSGCRGIELTIIDKVGSLRNLQCHQLNIGNTCKITTLFVDII